MAAIAAACFAAAAALEGVASADPTGARSAKDPRPPTTPPPEPGPIKGMGYIRVMHDTFDRLAQCRAGCRWSRKIFYKGLPPRNSHFVKNSVLHLVSRRRQGYPELAITTLSDNGRQGRSFRGGYFEARMKWTKGRIAWPGFWLLSRGNPTAANGPDYLISELDIFEGYGWAPAKFWGTLHRNTSGWYGVPDETRGIVETVGDLTTRFHTYAALWTETEVAWYLDGRELGRVPVFDSTDQEMFLILDLWIKRDIPVDASTPAELELQVDNVSVWQKFGDASPRER